MKQLYYCPECGIVTMTDGPKPCKGMIMRRVHAAVLTKLVPIMHNVVEEDDKVSIV